MKFVKFYINLLEVQIELADPATVHPRRFCLQQFLAACEATWMEIMDKYGHRSPSQEGNYSPRKAAGLPERLQASHKGCDPCRRLAAFLGG